VQELDWLESDTEPVDRFEGSDFGHAEARDERWVDVLKRSEYVLELPFDRIERRLIRQRLDRRFLNGVVPTDVVKPEGVIDMTVGKEDRIATIQTEAEGMFSMVRGAIQQDHPWITRRVAKANRGTASGSSIAKILALADRTITSDDRNATRCPRSAKRDVQFGDHLTLPDAVEAKDSAACCRRFRASATTPAGSSAPQIAADIATPHPPAAIT
jgi:hypothetical protein